MNENIWFTCEQVSDPSKGGPDPEPDKKDPGQKSAVKKNSNPDPNLYKKLDSSRK